MYIISQSANETCIFYVPNRCCKDKCTSIHKPLGSSAKSRIFMRLNPFYPFGITAPE